MEVENIFYLHAKTKSYCLKFYCFGKLVFLPELSWNFLYEVSIFN